MNQVCVIDNERIVFAFFDDVFSKGVFVVRKRPLNAPLLAQGLCVCEFIHLSPPYVDS